MTSRDYQRDWNACCSKSDSKKKWMNWSQWVTADTVLWCSASFVDDHLCHSGVPGSQEWEEICQTSWGNGFVNASVDCILLYDVCSWSWWWVTIWTQAPEMPNHTVLTSATLPRYFCYFLSSEHSLSLPSHSLPLSLSLVEFYKVSRSENHTPTLSGQHHRTKTPTVGRRCQWNEKCRRSLKM